MKNYMLIVLLFGSALLGNAQDTAWSFFAELEDAANMNGDSEYEIIYPDSLNLEVFSSGEALIKVDSVAKWQILYEFKSGWSHMVGGRNVITPLARISIPEVNQKKMKTSKAYKNARIYTGNELLKGLQMDHSFFTSKEKASGFPLTIARDARWNRTWMPITTDQYLVLRYVFSYPDGNVVSGYNETIFYFRRVE